MKSAVLQVPVIPIAEGHGAPMGAAIIAGVASGMFSSAAEAADRWITLKTPIESRTEIRPFYESRVDRYRSLLDSMNRYYTED